MKAQISNKMKILVIQYIIFMVPAMMIAAKGFADLWISGRTQPYMALTLLVLSSVMGLLFLTMASVFLYLSHRHFWIPPVKLIMLSTGMILYFDFSLGNTIGFVGLTGAAGLWFLWGLLAYRVSRSAVERS